MALLCLFCPMQSLESFGRYLLRQVGTTCHYTASEDKDGNVTNKIEDELFDLSKDLEISDIDYGLWFMDAIDNPDKYDHKNITIKVKYVGEIKEYNNVLIMGRRAMVCCADDITDIALPCIGIHKEDIDENKYYYITGEARCIENNEGMKVCAINVKDFKETGFGYSKNEESESIKTNKI